MRNSRETGWRRCRCWRWLDVQCCCWQSPDVATWRWTLPSCERCTTAEPLSREPRSRSLCRRSPAAGLHARTDYAPYIIRSLAICLLLIIAFDCIWCLLLQLLVSLSLFVFAWFVCVLCIFYVYMGQVPAIKLMMMMMITNFKVVQTVSIYGVLQFIWHYTPFPGKKV